MIILAIATIAVIGVGVSIVTSEPEVYVDKTDAEETLMSLGYEGSSVDSCSYEDGGNAFGIDIAKLSGNFTYREITLDYEFIYKSDKSLILAKIDGERISKVDHGVSLYDFSIIDEINSFEYTYDDGSGEKKKCISHAIPGTKYVVTEVMIKNLTCRDVDI